jgi:hypothetical protein
MSKAQPYESVVGCCDGCGAENVRIYRSEVGWTCVSCVLEEDQDEAYVSLYLEVAQGALAAEHERADEQQQSAVYLAGKLAEVDTERLALREALEPFARFAREELRAVTERGDTVPDDRVAFAKNDIRITYGDLRRAAEVLRKDDGRLLR